LTSREAFESDLSDLMDPAPSLARHKDGEYTDPGTLDLWLGWCMCNAYLKHHATEIAEVGNKYGDPEAFAERDLQMDAAMLQSLPIGTKLYGHPHPLAEDDEERPALDLVATMLITCGELKYSFNRDGSLKALRAVFRPSVTTSDGFQDEVLKALRLLKDSLKTAEGK